MNVSQKHINLKQDLKIEGEGTLDIYIQDATSPMILICPGGGYDHLSTREAIPVSDKFLSFGYNTAILRYSVAPFAYPTQLNEVNASIKYLSEVYKNIFIMGFSAGGHLAGIGGTDIYSSLLKGMILCYPVITLLNDYTHLGTQKHFLGSINNIENQNRFSINNRVNSSTIPTFIWTTKEDNAVPYQNSELMVEALRNYHIKNQYILFPHGPHGMALADDTATANGHEDCKNELVATWPIHADKFIKEIIKC